MLLKSEFFFKITFLYMSCDLHEIRFVDIDWLVSCKLVLFHILQTKPCIVDIVLFSKCQTLYDYHCSVKHVTTCLTNGNGMCRMRVVLLF